MHAAVGLADESGIESVSIARDGDPTRRSRSRARARPRRLTRRGDRRRPAGRIFSVYREACRSVRLGEMGVRDREWVIGVL
jgi:hypothetical protein